MKKTNTIFLAIATLALATQTLGCLYFSTKVSETAMCMHQSGLSAPGYIGTNKEASYTKNFNNDFSGELSSFDGMDITITLSYVDLHLLKGSPNWDFLSGLQMTFYTMTDESKPKFTLIDYTRSDAIVDSPHLRIETATKNNLRDYLAAGLFGMDLTIKGVMPTEQWDFDIDVCFTIKATYKEKIELLK